MPSHDEHLCLLPPAASAGVLIVCQDCGQRWVHYRHASWRKFRWFHLSARLRYGITLRGVAPHRPS